MKSKKPLKLTRRFAKLGLLPLLIAAPALASEGQDPICAPIQEFVASVQPGKTEGIIFRTIWGGNFKGTKEFKLGAKRCEHNNYAPAVAACKALVNHGAIESSTHNARRVIVCLSPDTRFGAGVRFKRGEFSLMVGTEERGSNVSVEYDKDAEMGGMALRVTANGY